MLSLFQRKQPDEQLATIFDVESKKAKVKRPWIISGVIMRAMAPQITGFSIV